MHANADPLPALRESALRSLRLRLAYEFINGAGLGLLLVAAVLAAGNWRMLDRPKLLGMLLILPLLYLLLMGLQQFLLTRACREHYRRLFTQTELLLILLSAEWPGQPIAAKEHLAGNRLEFKRRLQAVQRSWRELIALTGFPPLPRTWWILIWPYTLGLSLAALAAYLSPQFGFHAFTPPAVFILVAMHDAASSQNGIARDVFLVTLAEELGRSDAPALHLDT